MSMAEEFDTGSGIQRICEENVAVNKCEGACVSSLRPSALSVKGFHKVSKWCVQPAYAKVRKQWFKKKFKCWSNKQSELDQIVQDAWKLLKMHKNWKEIFLNIHSSLRENRISFHWFVCQMHQLLQWYNGWNHLSSAQLQYEKEVP